MSEQIVLLGLIGHLIARLYFVKSFEEVKLMLFFIQANFS